MGGFAAFPVLTTDSPFTTIDVASSTDYRNLNGARQLPGTIAVYPLNPAVFNLTTPTVGSGSYLIMKYVLYKSTLNPACVSASAPVYYTDDTFTTVTGQYTEALGGANTAAGWLGPNITALSQYTGAQLATALNNNYCWIILTGIIVNAYLSSAGAVGDSLVVTNAANWATTAVAAGTAPTAKVMGYQLTAVTSSIGSVSAQLVAY
jgi:hypothetical protein